MKYTFDIGTRYITRGISEKVPPLIQHMMWTMIDHKKQTHTMDYLQVFELKRKNDLFIIRHHQEEPPFEEETEITDTSYHHLSGIKIYVIDDITHSTMLLANEY